MKTRTRFDSAHAIASKGRLATIRRHLRANTERILDETPQIAVAHLSVARNAVVTRAGVVLSDEIVQSPLEVRLTKRRGRFTAKVGRKG